MPDVGAAQSDRLVEQLREMILIREFESRVGTLFENNELPGFVHLSIGQEAVATGACSAIEADDYITSTHRGHGHSIAKGLDPDRMMAELFGKANGYCGGKSGSMHIADVDSGMLGANGIVGAGPALAAGAGLSISRSGADRVCLSFFGDGAMAEGPVHESMNLAGVRDLPVVFICENNQYGEMTPAEDQHHVDGFEARGDVYDMPAETVDGMSVQDVYDATSTAVERARNGGGPSLIVCETYRYRGHYEGDPTTYRTDDEVDEWQERDPIDTLETSLVDAGLLEESAIEAMHAEASERIDEAVAFARTSDLPDAETAFLDVYTEEL
ncbi:thiamine pyrophosphate-dependent dehydrogenase E1 component subunit alpha [Natrinema caseinilyticum]|uniref:thiamine pyrophosphate-dependent dehydrogenase E1 component subunit alpha n=1 Tax=Natrinema caseinilyticum TaxID=2961570 RepID=UPI0020C4C6EA|nr:thiamine pyrophosphate-dependent dehydrogenase E1 component subunit alpha [Natrinema caseinilyticum]